MTSPEGQPVPALAATALFGCVVVVAPFVFVVIVRVEVMVTVRWAWLTSVVVVRDRDDDEPTATPIAPPTTAAIAATAIARTSDRLERAAPLGL